MGYCKVTVQPDSRSTRVSAGKDLEGYDEVRAVLGGPADGWQVTLVFTMPALVTFLRECMTVLGEDPNTAQAATLAALMKDLQEGMYK